MKIDGPKNTDTKKVDKSSKKSSASSADKTAFSQHLSSAMGADKIEGTERLVGAAGINSLLGLQAAEEATERESRKRLKERGEDILDHLDDLRMGLLTGQYSHNQLKNIEKMIEKQRDHISDPDLASILDDIELRAKVEIAKYEQG